MTDYKAKVMSTYPRARCVKWGGEWRVFNPVFCIGTGKTAFAAWVDAWRNIEKERGGK